MKFMKRSLALGARWMAVLPLGAGLLSACSADTGADPIEDVGEVVSQLAGAAIQVTIQAVIVKNDDGTVSGAERTCADVAAVVPALNTIYSSTKVAFQLDPARDCVVINSTMLNTDDAGGAGVQHQAVRDAVARRYPDKLVMLIRDAGGSFSSVAQNFVAFSNGDFAPGIFAHEIGHYFGLNHTHPAGTFGDGVTREEAIATIGTAIQKGQVTVANGLDALKLYYDDNIADTPIDLGPRAYVGFIEDPVGRCNTDLPLAVPGAQTYFHRPPYSNPMSYWKCPNVAPTFSPDQSVVIRRALLEGNRSHLRKGYATARAWGEIYPSPAAISRNQDEITVYATSADGRPYARTWRSPTGYDSAWFPMNGSTRAGYGYTPQAIFQPFTMYRSGAEIDVFSFFMDGHAQSKVFSNATGSYFPSNTEWFDQGVTAATSGPSGAARSATSFMLGLRATNGALFARNYDNGYAGWIDLGGKGETRPAVAARGANESHMFARWNDGSIRHRGWTTAGGWQASWEHLGGSGEGSPSVVGDGTNVDVFAVFEDRTIRTKRLTTTWSPSQTTWNNLGGSAASQPVVTLAGTTRVVVTRGTEGGIWLNTINSGISGSWLDAGGRTVGAPAVVARTSTEVVIYARWFDGSVKSRVRNLASGTWWPTTGWLDLGTPEGTAIPSTGSCPAMDITAPNAAFCSATCPCDVGEGDCDNNSQCRPGLKCVQQGSSFGLPQAYDVCVPVEPAYDPDNRSSSFCSSASQCDVGEGDCDTNSDCKPGLVCIKGRGTDYGAPADWDFCDVSL